MSRFENFLMHFIIFNTVEICEYYLNELLIKSYINICDTIDEIIVNG